MHVTHTPDTYTQGGTHTRWLRKTLTHSETQRNTHRQRHIQIPRQTQIQRYGKYDTLNRHGRHIQIETLKYRNTLTTDTHSDIRTHTRSGTVQLGGGRLLFLQDGEGGRQLPSPHYRSAPRSHGPEVHYRQEIYTNILTTTCPEV